MANYPGFAEGFLKAAGMPATRTNLDFVNNVWIPSEGTKAGFNPLATTTHRPGSTAFNSNGGFPVQNFRTLQDGISATAQTLLNGHYGGLVKLLQSGNATQADLARAVQQSPWGTKQGLIGKLAGGGKVGATASSGKGTTPIAAPSEVNQGGVDGSNPFARRAALAQHFMNEASATIGGSSNSSAWLNSILALVSIPESDTPTPTAGVSESSPAGVASSATATGPVKGEIFTSRGWKGTHVTDGLDWNHGAKTAGDIMAAAGTAVGAPENGKVTRWGSAQGGGSLYFQGESGTMYWLGHIDDRVPVGTTVKKNDVIARVSSDHAHPHLHIDKKI